MYRFQEYVSNERGTSENSKPMLITAEGKEAKVTNRNGVVSVPQGLRNRYIIQAVKTEDRFAITNIFMIRTVPESDIGTILALKKHIVYETCKDLDAGIFVDGFIEVISSTYTGS